MDYQDSNKIDALLIDLFKKTVLTHESVTRKFQARNLYFLVTNLLIVFYTLVYSLVSSFFTKIILCGLTYIIYLAVFVYCYHRIVKLSANVKICSSALNQQLLLCKEYSSTKLSEIRNYTEAYLKKLPTDEYMTIGMVKYNWLFVAAPSIFFIGSMAILFFN